MLFRGNSVLSEHLLALIEATRLLTESCLYLLQYNVHKMTIFQYLMFPVSCHGQANLQFLERKLLKCSFAINFVFIIFSLLNCYYCIFQRKMFNFFSNYTYEALFLTLKLHSNPQNQRFKYISLKSAIY